MRCRCCPRRSTSTSPRRAWTRRSPTPEMAGMSGLQAIRDRVVHASGKKNPTVREFIHFSGRGRVHNPIVGGPKEIADRLEQWFVERGLRRLRGFGDPRSRRLRGLRPFRGAGAAAPRPVPQGLCGRYLARESRDAGPAAGRLAPHAQTVGREEPVPAKRGSPSVFLRWEQRARFCAPLTPYGAPR